MGVRVVRTWGEGGEDMGMSGVSEGGEVGVKALCMS